MHTADQDVRLQGENVMLDEDAIQKLEKDDANMVLRYEYDEVERVLPMAEVEGLIRNIVEREERRTHKAEDFRKILEADKKFTSFARTHPTIYQKVTDRHTSTQEIETLCGLMSIRAKQERGELSDAQVAGGLEHYLRGRLQQHPTRQAGPPAGDTHS